jgi:hypothetical protein
MNPGTTDLYCCELAAIAARCDENDPDESVLTEMEQHVANCPICRGAESRLSEAVSRYRSYAAPGVSQKFESTIVTRLCGISKRDAESEGQA